MQGSILSVHVIDARDLESENGQASAQVKLAIEGQSSKTAVVERTNEPVWDEVIIFDIKKGVEPLQITVVDTKGERKPLCYASIPLEHLWANHPEEIDQMKKDQVWDLKVDADPFSANAGRSKIRIAMQWIYSKVNLLEDILEKV